MYTQLWVLSFDREKEKAEDGGFWCLVGGKSGWAVRQRMNKWSYLGTQRSFPDSASSPLVCSLRRYTCRHPIFPKSNPTGTASPAPSSPNRQQAGKKHDSPPLCFLHHDANNSITFRTHRRYQISSKQTGLSPNTACYMLITLIWCVSNPTPRPYTPCKYTIGRGGEDDRTMRMLRMMKSGRELQGSHPL